MLATTHLDTVCREKIGEISRRPRDRVTVNNARAGARISHVSSQLDQSALGFQSLTQRASGNKTKDAIGQWWAILGVIMSLDASDARRLGKKIS